MFNYSNLCEQDSTTASGQWKQSCIAISDKIAQESQSLAWRRIGNALSRRYSDLGSIEREFYQQADDGHYFEQRRSIEVEELAIEKIMATGEDIPISDDIWESYLQTFSNTSEIPAAKYLYEQLLSQ